jgi:ankyrin repeat protein
MLILGHKSGYIPRDSKLGTYIERAIQRTRSPTVYDYLLSLLDEASPDPHPAAIGTYHTEMLTRHLAAMSGAGDVAMLRHMLRLGADTSLKDSTSMKPLVRAISTCNFDIVNLLLSCGADPNGREKFGMHVNTPFGTSFATPLLAAVKTGSVAMVRRMLDAGAEAQLLDDEVWALRYAVHMEHTAVVELLLDGGVVSSDIAKAWGLWTAEKTGVESMAELLRSKGAELTPWVSPPRPWVPPPRMTQKGVGWYENIARQQLENFPWTPPSRRTLSLSLSRLPY